MRQAATYTEPMAPKMTKNESNSDKVQISNPSNENPLLQQTPSNTTTATKQFRTDSNEIMQEPSSNLTNSQKARKDSNQADEQKLIEASDGT